MLFLTRLKRCPGSKPPAQHAFTRHTWAVSHVDVLWAEPASFLGNRAFTLGFFGRMTRLPEQAAQVGGRRAEE